MKSLSPLKVGTLKQTNKAAILRQVWDHEALTKPQISETLGLSRATVSGRVNELLAEGWLQSVGRGNVSSLGGKPPSLVRINRQAGVAVAATIGGDYVEGALVDLSGNFVRHDRWESGAQPEAEAQVRLLCQLIESLLGSRDAAIPVLGICVGSAGLVDHTSGVLVMAAHLPGWRNVPVREVVAARFDLPVFVDNDARLWALAEYLFGSGRDVDNLVVVGRRLGLGAGVIIDGQLFRGVDNGAGEIGHSVMDTNGPLCRCGRRGCWETFVDDEVTLHQVRQRLLAGDSSCLQEWTGHRPDQVSIDQIYAAAIQGDPLAVRWAVEEMGHWFGVGIANIVNIFNPERVILLGKLATLGNPFLERVREVVGAAALPRLRDRVEIVLSSLGDRVRLLGPAALVILETVLSPGDRA